MPDAVYRKKVIDNAEKNLLDNLLELDRYIIIQIGTQNNNNKAAAMMDVIGKSIVTVENKKNIDVMINRINSIAIEKISIKLKLFTLNILKSISFPTVP
jgi:hypothetical protein